MIQPEELRPLEFEELEVVARRVFVDGMRLVCPAPSDHAFEPFAWEALEADSDTPIAVSFMVLN